MDSNTGEYTFNYAEVSPLYARGAYRWREKLILSGVYGEFDLGSPLTTGPAPDRYKRISRKTTAICGLILHVFSEFMSSVPPTAAPNRQNESLSEFRNVRAPKSCPPICLRTFSLFAPVPPLQLETNPRFRFIKRNGLLKASEGFV